MTIVNGDSVGFKSVKQHGTNKLTVHPGNEVEISKK
jgi:hypothetical protein